jgi:hypothetical protein
MINNQINQTQSVSNDLLINNTMQDNRSSISDKHTKIDDIIENDESNTYKKYINFFLKNQIEDIAKHVCYIVVKDYILNFKFVKHLHHT